MNQGEVGLGVEKREAPGFVVVLDEPQDLVNIAAVIRAMKNMGLRELRLVRPAAFDPWRIEGIAHRSEDIVRGVKILETVDEALGDCILVVGTSARARTAHRNYGHPRDLAGELVEHSRTGKVALLFGREDRGLSNAAIDRCDRILVIPTDPDYTSMNLAQAFLLVAYELFQAGAGSVTPLPRGKRTVGPATRAELEEMFGALERGLEAIGFFRVRSAEGVMRIFRTLFSRAALDGQEAGVVRAVGHEILAHMRRLERKSARKDE